MVRIGVFALIVAAALFLQYAFASGWIGPAAQVCIGILVGLTLVVLGEHHRQLDRRAFGEALTGGGIAILYTSIYAAYAFYEPALISHPIAFSLMILVTALGVVMAVRVDALSTAIIATVGGFLTPALLRGGGGMDGVASMITLFGYIAVLDVGLLALSFFKQWRSLQFLSFIGTWAFIWSWMAENYAHELVWPTCAAAGLFFVIFIFVPVVGSLWQRTRTRPEELGLILANPACFFLTTAPLLARDYGDFLGLYALLMALVYFALGNLARQRSPDDQMLSLSWLGLGLAFVTVAVPLQLQAHWIMLGWAAEGAILVWTGHRLRSQALRGVGLCLQTVVAVWMVTLYTIGAPATGFTPIFNETFLSFVGGLVALAVTMAIYARARDRAEESEPICSVLTVAISLLILYGLTAEMARLRVPSHLIMLLWAAEGAFLVWLGHAYRNRALRIVGLVLQSILSIWMLMLYSTIPTLLKGEMLPLFNGVFLSFVGGLASLAVTLTVYSRTGRAYAEGRHLPVVLTVAIAFLGLWGLTAEVTRSFHSLAGPGVESVRFAVSALWCVYAAILVGLGMVKRYAPIRLFGMLVFAAAVIKVFLHDVATLESVWRILSFVCLGLSLIGVSYLYHLYGQRIRAFSLQDEGYD